MWMSFSFGIGLVETDHFGKALADFVFGRLPGVPIGRPFGSGTSHAKHLARAERIWSGGTPTGSSETRSAPLQPVVEQSRRSSGGHFSGLPSL